MRKVAAIILAAGESLRFGRTKQLVEFEGRTLVRRAVDAAQGANCLPIVVVIGAMQSEIKNELRGTDAVIVENENWKCGMGASIRAGVQRLLAPDQDVAASVLMTCDQPFVDSVMIRSLVARQRETDKAIIASNYANTLGVPALFDRSLFDELLALDAMGGAKSVILSSRERVATIPFPEGKIDIDTVQDWRALKLSDTSQFTASRQRIS
jgi:molybdenum cofactor cytidylyltransferase